MNVPDSANSGEKQFFKAALLFYFIASVLITLCLYFQYSIDKPNGLKVFSGEGSFANLAIINFTIIVAWLLFGSLLFLLYRGMIHKKNIVVVCCFYLYAFIYLNILRERLHYGDIANSILAAQNIFNRQPLNGRYLYPPLFATVLSYFVPLGSFTVGFVCFIANYLSLLLFFVLLYKTLLRYNFSRDHAALLVFSFLCVNVPLLRTLAYIQVNLHVMNFILLSLLLYGNSSFLSAFCLSLAVHLKVSPIILVLPFVIQKDFKWLAQFVIINLGIIAATSLANKFDYYNNFLINLSNIYTANGITFRDNSIDSFLRSTFMFLHIPIAKAWLPILALKLAAVLVSLKILYKAIKNKVYCNTMAEGILVLYNGSIVLLFLMVILSPLLWEHYPVFIIFPFLVMLKKISGQVDLLLYITAYFLIFLVPTFDFYPFSYHRLFGLILCYMLLLRNYRDDSPWFKKINSALLTENWQP